MDIIEPPPRRSKLSAGRSALLVAGIGLAAAGAISVFDGGAALRRLGAETFGPPAPRSAPADPEAEAGVIRAGGPAASGAEALIRKVRKVEAVTSTPVETLVTARIDGMSDAGLVRMAAMTTIDVGKAIQRGGGLQSENVRIRFVADGSDRLGQPTDIELFQFTFASADLAAANLENLTFARVLSLANYAKTSGVDGRQAVTAWCGDADNFADAAQFCARLVRR